MENFHPGTHKTVGIQFLQAYEGMQRVVWVPYSILLNITPRDVRKRSSFRSLVSTVSSTVYVGRPWRSFFPPAL